MIGQQLDDYILVAKLGSGSVGDLYQARPAAGDDVVIKLVDPQLAGRPGFAERFVQTAELAQQRLSNQPGVCPILERRHTADDLYLVMPYFADGSLEAYRQKLEMLERRLLPEQVAKLGIRVARVLAQLRNAGLPAHGALHPHNILLRLEPVEDDLVEAELLLADFGLTHLVRQETAGDVNPYRGPAFYTPPALLDQSTGQLPQADERADLYALGTLLYLMLNGEYYLASAPVEEIKPAPDENFDPRQALQSLAVEAIEIYDREPARLTPTVLLQDLEAIVAAANWPAELRLPSPAARPEAAAVTERPSLPETPRSRSPGMVARIEISRHAGNGQTAPVASRLYEVAREQMLITIGRGRNQDIMLVDDAAVQPHHVDIERSDAGWTVTSRATEAPVYLEEKALSTGTPQPWYEGQSLRLGRYTLRLRDTGAAAPPAHPFRIDLLPAIQVISPGIQEKVGISIHNQGERSHFRVCVEGLPDDYYSLLQDGIVLNPDGRRDLTLKLHPPLNAPGGDVRYTVVAERLGHKPGETAKEAKSGVMRIRPTLPFAINLIADSAENDGRYRLLVQNRGNQRTRYTINGRSDGAALLFGLAGTEAMAEEPVAGMETVAAALRPGRSAQGQGVWPVLNRLPVVGRWLRQTAPVRQATQAQRQVAQAQRRTRLLTGLGRRPSGASVAPARASAERFAGELQQEITIKSGQGEVVYFQVRPRQRPLRWQPAQEYPFSVTVTPLGHVPTDTQPQTETAVLHVTSRLGQAAWVLLLGLLLLLCLSSAIIAGVQGSQVLQEIRLAQENGRALALADLDGDGIPDLIEVLVHGTDPLRADTDGDGLPDGFEINVSGISPILVDSDGDGRPDSEGFATITPSPPPGIIIPPPPPPLASTPRPTVTPTPVPTLAATPLPTATTIASVANDEASVIVLGDSDENQQQVHTLTFDTSILPPGSSVVRARLTLILADQASLHVLNGVLGRIYVTVDAGLHPPGSGGFERGDGLPRPDDVLMRYAAENLMVAELEPQAINLSGVTEVTLYFELGSNLDHQSNQVRFWSSNPPPGEHPPQLHLEYQLAADR